MPYRSWSDGDVIYNRDLKVSAHYTGRWMKGRLMVDGVLTDLVGEFVMVMMMTEPEYDTWRVDDCDWVCPLGEMRIM